MRYGLCALLAFAPLPALAQAPESVYRVLNLRAAPGVLAGVVTSWRERREAVAGTAQPLVLMRHSQGDQWDLMIMQPVGSLAMWYATDNTVRAAQEAFELGQRSLIAWREEMFVAGPPPEVFLNRASGAGLFHIEMFHAVAGQYEALLGERRMEDDYLVRTGRAANLIFERVAGASWDLFTIGFYRNLQHYAEEPGLAPEALEAAARAAGFQGRGTIGFELRAFLSDHHDTLASAIP